MLHFIIRLKKITEKESCYKNFTISNEFFFISCLHSNSSGKINYSESAAALGDRRRPSGLS